MEGWPEEEAVPMLQGSPDVLQELKSYLSGLESVIYFRFLHTSSGLSLWVGINEYDRGARYATYRLEDLVSEQFPNVSVHFHIIPVPEAAKIEVFRETA